MNFSGFIGVFVNTGAVCLGSAAGLLFGRFISEKITRAIMAVIGLATIVIGAQGALAPGNTLAMIAALVVGTAIGTGLDLDARLGRGAERLKTKFGGKNAAKSGDFVQGFVTGSILFCVGAMTITGSLTAGLTGDNGVIFTKSVLDLCSSCMLAAAFGPGVLLSAAFVLVFQGALVALAVPLAAVLPEPAIAELTKTASVIILGLGLNLSIGSDIKVTNSLPAVVLAPIAARWL
ncbi:MAG: DUF554 domain-containing protein [Oscillospiraceae bacterium]|jgi:uncharacterized membrane protein YqgA involved in biofilm formation|nr:DUF554 domain-containing protein [Oscillospiraceae bacterium]